ncbi:hypothetical protein ACFS7Z_02965 [Pontibacter toksunensis]|uniref:Uncharacterized protein n=1 Tax=Pontibacter toksunensis TaxID=1332631 RepID=A0ABW6BN89_9BACT
MKNLKVLFAMMAVAMLTFFSANDAKAQTTTVGTLLTGLLNVNVSDIEVNIGDITVQDLVDVENVLNNNNIQFLNRSINNNSILSDIQIDLTNAFREANLISGNQIVVGVLSGGQFVIQTLPL